MTKFEKLLLLLSDGNWHSTAELVESVGHRFSATIHIAVHQHHCQIEKRREGQSFEYRMVI